MGGHSQPLAHTEAGLVALCERLGAGRVGPVSAEEIALPRDDGRVPASRIKQTIEAIRAGRDPLGDAFCTLRSADERRRHGATYTPKSLVHSMVQWAATQGHPGRVIDPGTGSGRFLREAAHAFPKAQLIGVELDPLAAWVARASLAAHGLEGRAEIHRADYRSFELGPSDGRKTLFVGNPPYVRHHLIDRCWKDWLRETSMSRGMTASRLAGLHVHFFVATLEKARIGDIGAFVTSSEWLDVGYGQLLRELFTGPLGVLRLDILDPQIAAFTDALTTAVITCFRVGSREKSVRVRRVQSLRALSPLRGGATVPREGLAFAPRWSRPLPLPQQSTDLIELGELCRVSRGQATGANRIWIAADDTPELPRSVMYNTITRARELFAASGLLKCTDHLRSVIDLPADLDQLGTREREMVERFIEWARQLGAQQSYIARHRRPWWSVRLGQPAPIVATYMARRPPTFVRNLAGACHINIAHGLFPRDELPEPLLDALARYLSESVSTDSGRTYAGGLTKFEPGEMERLLVPRPEALAVLAAEMHAA